MIFPIQVVSKSIAMKHNALRGKGVNRFNTVKGLKLSLVCSCAKFVAVTVRNPRAHHLTLGKSLKAEVSQTDKTMALV